MTFDPFAPPLFIECTVERFEDTLPLFPKMNSFIFRGHRDSKWTLSSSFEREFNLFPRSQMIEGAEHYSIEFFRKRAHLFDLGGSNSGLADTLATMQHYGCPTRLIDFTKSPQVGLFFAVREHAAGGTSFALWCMNHPILRHREHELFRSGGSWDVEAFLKNRVFDLRSMSPPGIIELDPTQISRRMSAQQGVLIMQTNIRRQFLDNLRHALQIDRLPVSVDSASLAEVQKNILNTVRLIKLVFPASELQRVRKSLISNNTTSEVLFPDLAGVSRSAVEHLFWTY